MLGDELFGRLHRLSAEIVVPGAGNTHEALGRPDQTHTSRSPSVTGTTASFSTCTTSTGAVTLPTRRSERNWSFMKRRTGTNQ